MTAKKLTEADKCEILKLYHNPEETTSTLAVRYSVSHSTISRLLKSTLLADEYEVLIQQKRSVRGHHTTTQAQEPEDKVALVATAPRVEPVGETAEVESPGSRRSRRRSSAVEPPVIKVIPEKSSLPPDLDREETTEKTDELLSRTYSAEVSTIRKMLGEDLLDNDDDLDDDDLDDDDLDDDDLDDDDLDDDDLDDDDLDDDDLDDDDDLNDDDGAVLLTPSRRVRVGSLIQVLPLSEASFPKPCYLVVDRSAELITRPLKDFGDLGQIPKEEIQQRTLPVFDNHRIARRFSNRNQRVIKVPDGRMLQKTSTYLKAKGITRLLIDGQVYSLSQN